MTLPPLTNHTPTGDTPDYRYRHPIYDTVYPAALSAMFRLQPETIHGIANTAVAAYARSGPLRRAAVAAFGRHDRILHNTVAGIDFPAPLGLAAGFDKNGTAAAAWQALGFGYAELGTVTLRPQPGNDAPRLFRLPADKALINRMGFNNHGATLVAKNLNARAGDGIIGINIGKNKTTPAADAVDEYRKTAAILSPLADYVTVNVSSPNTPGLRDLQAVDSLRPIVAAVRDVSAVPVFVKIAPDLNNDDVDAVATMAVEEGLSGIVATNTTISRDGLRTDAATVERIGVGGLSGPPVRARSLEIISQLYQSVGDTLAIIGVGGITGPRAAWDAIAAGASLIQGYTGFIYGGPMWVADIHRGIADQLRLHGFTHISEAVGCGLDFAPAPTMHTADPR